ncbi:MAG: MFS transporter, partial [Planctomycetota bacterium]
MFESARARFLILIFAHFTADFYGGLLTTLPDPTLKSHLGRSLVDVMYLMSLFSVVVNAIQPITGLLLPKRGVPSLLLRGPLMASAMCCIGFTHSYAGLGALLVLSGLGIGLLHPEAVLAAQGIIGARQGMGISLFLSGGYFGYSFGNWLGAEWASRWGLTNFWTMGGLVVVTLLLVRASGLHRLHGRASMEPPVAERHGIGFPAVFALG